MTRDQATADSVGMFTLPKATGALMWGAGGHWDGTNSVATGTATGNKLIGANADAASADATAPLVRFNGTTD